MTERPTSLTPPPAGYSDWLADLKTRIHSAQQRAALARALELGHGAHARHVGLLERDGVVLGEAGAGAGPQAHAADRHLLVDRLRHVVDREPQRHKRVVERLREPVGHHPVLGAVHEQDRRGHPGDAADLYAAVQAGVKAGEELKAVYQRTMAALRPKYGHWVIFDHCMPFDVTRAYDEAGGLSHPRIWTAERDVEMWKALEGA